MFAALGLTAAMAVAQMAQQPLPSAGAPGASSDMVRIRKPPVPEKVKTPVFRTAVQGQVSARQPDWWRGVVEFETTPDWIDELEFTYYAYIEDQSNRGAPVMFRGMVTYVNVAKGRHVSDIFLHPNTIARMGLVKQVAVVVKVKGAVVASESTATKPNWWDGFPPVDGVLLNRSQTPFTFIDYDLYEAIKPAPAGR
jgi:hypothetical protein